MKVETLLMDVEQNSCPLTQGMRGAAARVTKALPGVLTPALLLLGLVGGGWCYCNFGFGYI